MMLSLFLLLFTFELYADPDRDCVSVIQRYVEATRSEQKIISLPDGTAWKSKEVSPLLDQARLAEQKGNELQVLKAEIDSLKKTQPQGWQEKLNQLTSIHQAAEAQLVTINDRYVKDLQTVYEKAGIPSTLIKAPEGHLLLELDLNQKANNKAVELFRRLKSRFNVNDITISLKENAQYGRGGFFDRNVGRLELGSIQAIDLLDESVLYVGKHESRHAWFLNRRKQGDSSLFHADFFTTQSGDTLNQGFYKKRMTAEELYNYSTDMQALSRASRTDPNLFDEIIDHNKHLGVIAESHRSLSQDLLKSVDEMLASKNFQRFQAGKEVDGSMGLQIMDSSGRVIHFKYVSPYEKKLVQEKLDADLKFENARDLYVNAQLKNLGFNPEEMGSRLDKLTAPENEALTKLKEGFHTTAEGSKLFSEITLASEVLAQSAKKKLQGLMLLGKVQKEQSLKLQEMLDLYQHPINGGKAQQMEDIRRQMSLIGSNVKEKYTGSPLNIVKRKPQDFKYNIVQVNGETLVGLRQADGSWKQASITNASDDQLVKNYKDAASNYQQSLDSYRSIKLAEVRSRSPGSSQVGFLHDKELLEKIPEDFEQTVTGKALMQKMTTAHASLVAKAQELSKMTPALPMAQNVTHSEITQLQKSLRTTKDNGFSFPVAGKSEKIKFTSSQDKRLVQDFLQAQGRYEVEADKFYLEVSSAKNRIPTPHQDYFKNNPADKAERENLRRISHKRFDETLQGQHYRGKMNDSYHKIMARSTEMNTPAPVSGKLIAPSQVDILSPSLKNGKFNVAKTAAFSDDAVTIGIQNEGHMFLMVGGKRFDADPLLKSKVRDTAISKEGVFFKLNLPDEKVQAVKAALEKRAGKRSWSCVDGVCRILEEADIVIKDDKGGMRLRLRPILHGLTNGEIKVDGQLMNKSNVRMYASSQAKLDDFLANTTKRMENLRTYFIVCYAGVPGTMVAYEVLEE